MERLAGTVVSSSIAGRAIRFFVADPGDTIQSHHMDGGFYEVEELAIISEFLPQGSSFVDIGANVGNHAIFVSKFCFPARVILFEPHPTAIDILRINLALNGLEDLVDTSKLGIGLSNEDAKASLDTVAGNLGYSRMRFGGADATIPVTTGDIALRGERVDFLKIDVEGLELRVIDGLRATILAYRPNIFVEVENANTPAFIAWSKVAGYEIVRRFRRYAAQENVMLTSR